MTISLAGSDIRVALSGARGPSTWTGISPTGAQTLAPEDTPDASTIGILDFTDTTSNDVLIATGSIIYKLVVPEGKYFRCRLTGSPDFVSKDYADAAAILAAYGVVANITLPNGQKYIQGDVGDTFLVRGEASSQARILWYNVAQRPSINRNWAINGDFALWTPGTSFSLSSATKTEFADTWWAYRNATGCTVSRQTGFAGARYCVRLARDSGNTSTQTIQLGHQIPTAVAMAMAGKKFNVTFNVRIGASFSGTTLPVRYYTGVGADEAFNMGTAAFASTTTSTSLFSNTLTGAPLQTLDTTDTHYNASATTVPSDTTELFLRLLWTPVGTAGAADYIEITNIKIEQSTSFTPFQPDPIGLTSAACVYHRALGI